MDSTCDPHDGAPCAGGCETAAWAMRPMHDQFPMTIQRVRRNCIVRLHNFGGARAAGCLPGHGGAAWLEHLRIAAWCLPRHADIRRMAPSPSRMPAPVRRAGVVAVVVVVVPEQGVQRWRGACHADIRRPAPSPGSMPAPMRRARAVAVVVVVPEQGVQRRRGAGHADIRRPAPSPSRMPSPVRRAGAVAVAWAWSSKASSVGVVPATPISAGRLHHPAACPRQCAGPAQWPSSCSCPNKASSIGVVPATPISAGRLHHPAACPRQCAGPAQWPSSWSCPNKASSRRCDGPHSPIAGWISMALQASRWLPLSAASIAACS